MYERRYPSPPLPEHLFVFFTVKCTFPIFPNNSTHLQPHIACRDIENLLKTTPTVKQSFDRPIPSC